ncbi:hypothetical protein CCACVL1_16268 [Corchorus capsularis]|uniref:TF-B3 domain-containing protein n=1 Tax=Corchorus capsularis TaxID=210143 RepID=A0A1R3HY29_COCAP|nr:hypothetical protein CCACVL1_16268 [Corchorus capsularis]
MGIRKKIEEGDSKKLTIGGTFSSGKQRGKMKVEDDRGGIWTFDYKVSNNTMVISGDWCKFFQSYGLQVGNRIAIDDNYEYRKSVAEYKIEVI